MFGLMAIVNVILIGLVLLTDLGVGQNIIQSKKAHDAHFLNSAWSFQIMRGFFVWAVSILVAIGVYFAQTYHLLPSGKVYSEPLLPFIIPVAALTTLIGAFEPTWVVLSKRGLQLARLVKIELVCQLAGVGIMIVLAILFKSVWALVAGSLVTSIAYILIVGVLIKEERNYFVFDKEVLKEIFHFGKWVFLSSVVGFLINNGDRLLLGGLISTSELGIYSIAAFMVGAVFMVVSRLMGSVAFPALSEAVRERPHDLKRVYYRFRVLFDAGLLMVAGILFVSGQTIVDVLYDTRYQNAGWMLSALSLGLIALRFNLADQCYIALGKPKVMTILIVIRTVFLFVLLPLAFKQYGLQGAIWAIVISGFASVPMAIYFKQQHGLLDIKKELITAPVFIVGLAIGFIINKIVQYVH